jgi:succinoglycan biosynthesis protein ExoO
MEQTIPDLRELEPPTISVLIPAYNAGGFLHRAVRSAIKQTRAPLEILIVDDASTDDTFAVANELAADDSRVRVFKLPQNSGPAAARNAGLNAARGDWIAPLDADDAFVPSRLETLAQAHAGKSTDIVLDNFLWFDVAGAAAVSAGLPVSDTIECVDLYDFVEHARPGEADWALLKPMFRRAFLDAHRLRYPEFSRHGEDFLLMFHALHAGAHCLLLRTPGYIYTMRDSGMSRTTINYKRMVRDTVDLLNDPSVRRDFRLSKLLRRRVAAINRWSTEFQVREAKKKKHYLQIALLLMNDPGFIIRAMTLLSRKIMRR